MKKINLTVLDRISLLNVLPREGNFLTLSIVKDINKKIEILQDEAKEIGLTFKDSRVQWSPEAKEKEVEFTESELSVITKTLKQLDKQEKLPTDLFDAYKKFGVNEEEEK